MSFRAFFSRWLPLWLSSALSLLAASDPAARTLLLDAWALGPDLVAVGERGAVLRSTDSGRTWLRCPVPTRATLTAVAFAADRTHGWIVGHDATILATTDGGLTWTAQHATDQLDTSLLTVCALDAQTVIAAGAYGQGFVTHDGGQTWQAIHPYDEDLHLNALVLSPPGTLLLVGERGLLLRSTDQGVTWQRVGSPYESSFYGLLHLGGASMLAHGLRGHLIRSDDDGQTWQAVPSAPTALIVTSVQRPEGTVVLAGQARAFLVSRDDGHTFSPWSPGLTTAVAKLLVAPDGTLLAFGEAGATRLPAP